MSISTTSLSVKLNSTSSLLLERARIISLNLKPNPSSLSQIIRNLTSIKLDLDQLQLEHGLGQDQKGKLIDDGSGSEVQTREIEELCERYDKLLEMLSEDELGKAKVNELRREERRSPSPPIPTPSPKPIPSPIQTPTSAEVPSLHIEPPTPGIQKNDLKPFKDYPDDYDLDEEERAAGMSHNEMLDHQQMMMNDQDERLNLLSNSIGRQNDLSVQIGSELDIHHQLLEDTDHAMDRTAHNLNRAKRRLDKVAGEARQYGEYT
ncbi:syntaxin 8 [Kwoniella mangroviensis CBS 10435]|uniref:Syntaxin 8 n=1 Tax=Kwoniella mangroviensis CBS 10435 TaxID=1331196 RepID=A0A1B9J0R4_9TREE|nr:syntaxin 8 [Kwoniella mangroviensis CBS 8507]OCF61254.1 syntaxin 8 [Kwoniella mangroviensis CBS 10435]OCF64928.1 syntaxin 8 [Kwoniella mangroviensis CBS 8507]OCF77272.1 syntaxin 8 [Kwoniella mangroviensis CBS 8886]